MTTRAAPILRARTAIITVPVGVLVRPASAGGIRFEPEPARVRAALTGFAMGSVVRVTFAFARDPWERIAHGGARRLSFVQLFGDSFQVAWTAYPRRAPLVVLWCGGPRAGALARDGRAAVLATARRELAHALRTSPTALRSSLRGAWWHDWDRDPCARGAYAYARVGGEDASRRLARPEEDTLFFAGEATDPEGGTVDAALASGWRAARQVRSRLHGARTR